MIAPGRTCGGRRCGRYRARPPPRNCARSRTRIISVRIGNFAQRCLAAAVRFVSCPARTAQAGNSSRAPRGCVRPCQARVPVQPSARHCAGGHLRRFPGKPFARRRAFEKTLPHGGAPTPQGHRLNGAPQSRAFMRYRPFVARHRAWRRFSDIRTDCQPESDKISPGTRLANPPSSRELRSQPCDK